MNIEIHFNSDVYNEYKKLQNYVKDNIKRSGKPTYKQLLFSINFTLNNIKQNPRYGSLIPRNYLNKNILKKYKTGKIYRAELVGYWRLLYSLEGNEVQIIALILDFIDHKKYNKLFEYKKK